MAYYKYINMTKREQDLNVYSKIIVDHLPYCELPFEKYEDNLKMIRQLLTIDISIIIQMLKHYGEKDLIKRIKKI